MSTPFSFKSFIQPLKTLHFFGEAGAGLADAFVHQAVEAGWAVVNWGGIGVPFPRLEDGVHTIVRVRAVERNMSWSITLPEVHHLIQTADIPVMLVGVSKHDADVPIAWKFFAHARFKADSKDSFDVVKDHVSTERYQGCKIHLVDGVYMGSPWDQAPVGA